MRTTGWIILVLLSLGVAGYAVYAYSVLPLGAMVHPDMRDSFNAHRVGILAHVFGASVALALGPFQFSPRMRARSPSLHRWSGRFYLGLGVLVGGMAGLYMAQHAFGGVIARLGFGALALAWLGTGVLAYRAIRTGDIISHRRWMVRNFALSFAAVTLRLYLPASFATGMDFATAYAGIAWLCWVPNLIFAEWWLKRSSTPIQTATR